MKALQKFSDEYLEQCREMSTEQIVRFLDDFRRLHGAKNHTQPHAISVQKSTSPSKLISMKVPEDLLFVFRTKAAMTDTPYQTQIKKLMLQWVVEEES